MPTPDASAFVRQKKLAAIQGREQTPGLKVVSTRLYQYVPKTSSLSDFLPSFTNKIVSPYTQLKRTSGGMYHIQYIRPANALGHY
jgi:hypothetical protein